MCDTIIKEVADDVPQYVYKIVTKISNGKYVTPIMGEYLQKGTWKKAPILRKRLTKFLAKEEIVSLLRRVEDGFNSSLVDFLPENIFKSRRKVWTRSSPYAKHHDGRWNSFKDFRNTQDASLANNFDGKTKVVKCEIRGNVSSARFAGKDTYLSEYIRIVEEMP